MKQLVFALTMIAMASVHQAWAHPQLENFEQKNILADLSALRDLNIPVLAKDEKLNVGYAVINPKMQWNLSKYNHEHGKCAGFETLPQEPTASITGYLDIIKNLASLQEKDQAYSRLSFRKMTVERNPEIDKAITEISEDNIRGTIDWLANYPDRYNMGKNPNAHVLDMKAKLEQLLSNYPGSSAVDLIDHRSTKQKSIRVRLSGTTKPDEIVVLGGHLDSINQSWGGGNAPGADDNASGSANLFEALRILISKGKPQRTVEFFWYAGEESGLLGSAEIAKQYKQENKKVVAVLQLDMTLFPGEGEFVIGNMTDYTSTWLRDYLVEINRLYLNGRIVEDKCGYGCSDHASWYRQGYPTLMPFEATMKTMNDNIHSTRDVVTPQMSFRHSVMFTKLALTFAMDLANSDRSQPY